MFNKLLKWLLSSEVEKESVESKILKLNKPNQSELELLNELRSLDKVEVEKK